MKATLETIVIMERWLREMQNSFFQFPISFEESKKLSMEVNSMEVLKNILARSLEYLYGKDEKKKKLVLSNPKQSRGDI